MASHPRVMVMMGSSSDHAIMAETETMLGELGIPFELRIASAHRTPDRVALLAGEAAGRGIMVIIAAAGLAAHLPGVVAAHTALPVIGVPLEASALGGIDALLSMVQMPPGVPVATVAVGRAGAKNAAVLAARILALSDATLAERLRRYRQRIADDVAQADAALPR